MCLCFARKLWGMPAPPTTPSTRSAFCLPLLSGCTPTTATPHHTTCSLIAPHTRAGTLNRAEWVKFLGLFFNLEAEASEIFAGVQAEYEATKVWRWRHRGSSSSNNSCRGRSRRAVWKRRRSRGQALQAAGWRGVPSAAPANTLALAPLLCVQSEATAASQAKKPVLAWIQFFEFEGDSECCCRR